MINKRLLAVLFAAAILLAPLIAYFWFLGPYISHKTNEWSEFGSFVGGIYSPILTLLTFFLLARQLQLQIKMSEHERDHAYLEQARADIAFYCSQMALAVDEIVIAEQTLKEILRGNFEFKEIEMLDSDRLREMASLIHTEIPPAFDVWGAVYPILAGLGSAKGSMYRMTLGSSKQKLIATLSYRTCVALDNFHRVRCEGKVKYDYLFSPLLLKNED